MVRVVAELPGTEQLADFKQLNSEGGRGGRRRGRGREGGRREGGKGGGREGRREGGKEGGRDFLSGLLSGLRYFQCVEVLALLKSSEGEAKTLLGSYSSLRVRVNCCHTSSVSAIS